MKIERSTMLWTCALCSLGTCDLIDGRPLCRVHGAIYHDFIRRVNRALEAGVTREEAMPAIADDMVFTGPVLEIGIAS